MKIIFAAGGTGGHINPALAAAGEIREKYPDAQILFIGTKDKMEARLVPAAGFDFRTIEISGFYRQLTLENIKRNIKTLSHLLSSSKEAKKIIKEFKPDVVVGFGGYVSGPVLREAQKLSIPTAIHEQNAYPGITNKALAKNADAVMLATPKAAQYLECKNEPIVTGLPVRGELLRAERALSREELGVKENQTLVLSMGGSLGAEAINKAMVSLIAANYKNKELYFLHATGQFINDMARCMSAADIVICRAGASSLSEIEALGKASILIPSPNVAENHQYHNAMALVEKDAALLIEEKDLTKESLQAAFDSLSKNKEKLLETAKNAKSLSIGNAKEKIAQIIVSLAQ